MKTIENRYEFVLLLDVENGNPNGDPDAGNMPRIDPETGHGIITDVCLKRKIRNYVDLVKEGAPGYKIYVQQDEPLNDLHANAYKQIDIELSENDKVKVAQQFMCQNYYDVRTFGAVMNTGNHKCGTVRGPVQINFAKSIDPIFQQEYTITRMAATTAEDFKEKGSSTMGRKHIVPYGLYRAEGYISAALAKKVTGFNDDDLELFWDALINMFEHDHSAARGKMAVRRLVIFKHNTLLGDIPSQKLFDLVKVVKKDIDKPARSFSDYEVFIDHTLYLDKVSLIEKL